MLLSQYGWESRWSTRKELWPLVEDHALLLEDTFDDFHPTMDFESGRYELGSPVSNLDFIAEEQFQLGQPVKRSRRQLSSDIDDDDDDDNESGIHMAEIKPRSQMYSSDTRLQNSRMKSKTLPLPHTIYSRSGFAPARAHTVRSIALSDPVKDRTRSVEHISSDRDFTISREQRSQSVNLGVKHKLEADSVINNNVYSAVDKNTVQSPTLGSPKETGGQKVEESASESEISASVKSDSLIEISCDTMRTDRTNTISSVPEEDFTTETEQNQELPNTVQGNTIEISVTDTDQETDIHDNQNQLKVTTEQGDGDRNTDSIVTQLVLEAHGQSMEQKHDSSEVAEEIDKLTESVESSRRDFFKKSVSVKEERSSSSESSQTSKSRTDSFNTDMTSGVDSFSSGGLEFRSLSPIASTNSLNTGEVQMRHKEKRDSREHLQNQHHSTNLRRLSNLTRVPSLRRASSPGVGLMPASKFFDFSESAIMYTTAKDAIGYATLRSLMKTRQISLDMESDYGLNNLYDNLGSMTSINRRSSIDSMEMRRPKR